jgi:hypothetical protein
MFNTKPLDAAQEKSSLPYKIQVALPGAVLSYECIDPVEINDRVEVQDGVRFFQTGIVVALTSDYPGRLCHCKLDADNEAWRAVYRNGTPRTAIVERGSKFLKAYDQFVKQLSVAIIQAENAGINFALAADPTARPRQKPKSDAWFFEQTIYDAWERGRARVFVAVPKVGV